MDDDYGKREESWFILHVKIPRGDTNGVGAEDDVTITLLLMGVVLKLLSLRIHPPRLWDRALRQNKVPVWCTK